MIWLHEKKNNDKNVRPSSTSLSLMPHADERLPIAEGLNSYIKLKIDG